MTPDQRAELVRILESGDAVSPEWSRIIFPPDRREYELIYDGKAREEEVISDTLAVPLQKMREFGDGNGDWENKLIFGDNAQAMKTLLELKRSGGLRNADGTSGVRLVYIDPPFATKQEFRGTQEQKAYQDKVASAQFIEFVRRRLIFIRELLADDGVLYLHLDQRKGHYLKVIADEVFGENRFKNEIIWQRTNAHNETLQYGRIHDAIYFYTKSDSYVWTPERVDFSKAQLSRYKQDENGRWYTCQDLCAERKNSESGRFNWRGTMPSQGRGWGYKIEQLEQWWSEGRIATKKNGAPRMDGLIVYLDEQDGQTPQSIWSDVPRIANTSAERLGYPTQKPEALLKRIIYTSSGGGDIVLDAFAGSGTTCAVAEKMGRRWIAIDCGKLAIYTIQKRMLNLRTDIGNKGRPLKPSRFALFNAGLYDFSKLRELPWWSWRFFALKLFGCQDSPHIVGGVHFDGTLRGSSVLVFNFQERPGVRIDESTIESLAEAIGEKAGPRVFIIAPALTFDFQQDYLDAGATRFYALRIPYSIVNELHARDFLALAQPSDAKDVNDTVEAVGFDFIKRPDIAYACGVDKSTKLFPEATIKIERFISEASVRKTAQARENLETFSMLMIDYDYPKTGTNADIFEVDEVFYAHDIEHNDWTIKFPFERLGPFCMAIFLDIFGNEARELIDTGALFGRPATAREASVKKIQNDGKPRGSNGIAKAQSTKARNKR